MSFWTKIGVKITDLTIFKQACEQNGVEYVINKDKNRKWNNFAVHATLKDKHGPNHGFLIKDGGAFRMVMDQDAGYSSLTRRLGKNGGTLGRTYSENVVRKGIRAKGGMVNSAKTMNDGSVVLRVAI